MLARVKVEWIHLWDPDTVETVNMAGQLFGNSDIGNYKTSAVTSCIMNYADYHNYIANREELLLILQCLWMLKYSSVDLITWRQEKLSLKMV